MEILKLFRNEPRQKWHIYIFNPIHVGQWSLCKTEYFQPTSETQQATLNKINENHLCKNCFNLYDKEVEVMLTIHTPLNKTTFNDNDTSIYREIAAFLDEDLDEDVPPPFLVITTNWKGIYRKIIYGRKCLENSIITIEEKELS